MTMTYDGDRDPAVALRHRALRMLTDAHQHAQNALDWAQDEIRRVEPLPPADRALIASGDLTPFNRLELRLGAWR